MRRILSLSYEHLLRRLYELKHSRESSSQWMLRSGITTEEVEEALHSDENWDLPARRIGEILRNCGISSIALWEWVVLGSDAPGLGASLCREMDSLIFRVKDTIEERRVAESNYQKQVRVSKNALLWIVPIGTALVAVGAKALQLYSVLLGRLLGVSC